MFAVTDKRKAPTGRLYILEIITEDLQIIHKIGMCYTDRTTDRMMEILRSWFVAYRYSPYTIWKLNFETKDPYLLEKDVHATLAEYKWKPDKKIDGCEEMFTGLDIEEVIDYIKSVKVGE